MRTWRHLLLLRRRPETELSLLFKVLFCSFYKSESIASICHSALSSAIMLDIPPIFLCLLTLLLEHPQCSDFKSFLVANQLVVKDTASLFSYSHYTCSSISWGSPVYLLSLLSLHQLSFLHLSSSFDFMSCYFNNTPAKP